MAGDDLRAGEAATGKRLLRLIFVLLLAGAVAGCGGGSNGAPPVASKQTGTHTEQSKTTAMPVQEDGKSVDASALTRHVPVYRSPTSSHPFLRLSNPTSTGQPLVFLVKRRAPDGWEQVYLPVRPDESTGWINDRYLSLEWNSYSLQVRLNAHRLVLRKDGNVVARFPAAVGRSVLPTPHGRYYLVELLKQPDPNGVYGPYAFGTSAFSHVLYSFGGGPGQIGIHGTNEPMSIGHSASHGCIRIPNRDIVRLAHLLPLGTPVTIES